MDALILSTLAAGDADFLVTGDKDLLVLAGCPTVTSELYDISEERKPGDPSRQGLVE